MGKPVCSHERLRDGYINRGCSTSHGPRHKPGVYAGEGDSVRAVQGTNILSVTHSFDKLGRTEQNYLKVSGYPESRKAKGWWESIAVLFPVSGAAFVVAI